MRLLPSAALVLCLLASACDGAPTSPATPGDDAIASRAAALDIAGSGDSADHDCRVVLRSVGRQPGGPDYETDCSEGACTYVWRGSVDVAGALPAEATVHVQYRLASEPSWWEVQAVPATGLPDVRRYTFALARHLFGPGDEQAGQVIELVAFVLLPDGGRLFDHNRYPGDFDNFRLTSDDGFAASDGGACPITMGWLSFLPDWQELRSGELRRDGYLQVDYALERLPQCRGTHNGYPAWDVVAYVKFLPGGQLSSGSVRDLVTYNGTPTNQGVSKPFLVKIPSDADAVELWFRNYTGAGSSCEAWDSNFDANYRFDVWPLATDPRCLDVEKERGNHYESDQMTINAPTCLAYTLASQADATGCELWVEGFGDGHMGHYGIPFDWLVGWLRVGPNDGSVLNAGLYTQYRDNATGAAGQRFSLGLEVSPGLWKAGFADHVTGFQGMGPVDVTVDAFAFFLDVLRPSGEVVRLWQSRGGANFRWDDAFGLQPTLEYIPYGNVRWAAADATVLESARACR
jgi:hypothetical protein